MGVAAVQQHHHKSTTKSPHRPFKSRHASKGALKEIAKGKVESGSTGHRKSRQQQVMSKIERKHQARQKQQAKYRQHMQNTSIFSGQKGAPRIVAVVPLTADCDATAAIRSLAESLEIGAEVQPNQPSIIEVERFKQRLQFIPTSRQILEVLNACQVADYVLFILSGEEEVDSQGELLLRTIESQGVSSVFTAVQNIEASQSAKKKTQVISSLKSFITHFFPAQDKLIALENKQDCVNVMRSLCTSTPKGVRWRDDRSWMVVEKSEWVDETADKTHNTTNLVITGTVRGKALQVDRLVQLGDIGSFQIETILSAPDQRGRKRKATEMAMEAESVQETLAVPTADQDDTIDLAPEDVDMDGDNVGVSVAPTERRGVLLDDHHYFSDEEPQPTRRPKRLPKGTSEYQSAWYLDDISYSGSDLESDNEADAADETDEDEADGADDAAMRDATEGAPSEYAQSEMFVDRPVEDEADELAAYRKSRRDEAQDDLEFPDEIELHPNVLARERLVRYRGLKSLRTSEWDTTEDMGHEPTEWTRLLQIPNYRGAKARALGEALIGGVAAGTRVAVFLRAVPRASQSTLEASRPLTAFSLLRHEQKQTVTNVSISLDSELTRPLKSKEELIMQCGPRRFIINPLYSTAGTTPNNVHKFGRFLHPGQSAMATVIAPLTWGSVPAVFFRRRTTSSAQDAETELGQEDAGLEFVGTGTMQPPDQSRVIAKRVVLTGHPFKIHRKVVTVRYMFFNTEDVKWFKALQLWTRRGRSGFIKESLGTHGYFKANFDAKINPQDSVAVSLYKRVFPRQALRWISAASTPANKRGSQTLSGGLEDMVAE